MVGFVDASKAFDRVNHHKLFVKLRERGVPGAFIIILSYWMMESCFNSKLEKQELIEIDDLKRNLSSEFSTQHATQEHLQVYLRVRPFTSAERDSGESQSCVTIEPPDTVLLKPPSSSLSARLSDKSVPQIGQRFQFSQVHGPDTTQRELFEGTVKSLVSDVLQGGNSLVFTYGVTNAGKTFTFLGPDADRGILPRSLNVIFGSIEERVFTQMTIKPHRCQEFIRLTKEQQAEEAVGKRNLFRQLKESEKSSASQSCSTVFVLVPGSTLLGTTTLAAEDGVNLELQTNTKFSVWVSFCEIYNENIHDLLQTMPTGALKRTALRLSQDVKGNSFIKDLRWVQVNSAEEAYSIVKLGKRNQSFSSTKLNHLSSRSHSIFSIRILRIEDAGIPRVHAVSELSLCDLAGSERCAKTQNKGERLKEAGNINTSLLILGKCINALRHNQQAKLLQHVPFRESKLTHYLQGFFCGRGTACILVNINQCASMYDETLNVLKFSALAQKVVVVNKTLPIIPQRSACEVSMIINNAGRKALRGSRRSSLIGWESSLEDVQEDDDRDSGEEDSLMEDTEQERGDEDDDDEEVVIRKGTYQRQVALLEQLQVQLKSERAENMLLEARVREDVCKEFTELFSTMQTDFNERLEREREISEERAERRLEIYKDLVSNLTTTEARLAAQAADKSLDLDSIMDFMSCDLDAIKRDAEAAHTCLDSSGRLLGSPSRVLGSSGRPGDQADGCDGVEDNLGHKVSELNRQLREVQEQLVLKTAELENLTQQQHQTNKDLTETQKSLKSQELKVSQLMEICHEKDKTISKLQTTIERQVGDSTKDKETVDSIREEIARLKSDCTCGQKSRAGEELGGSRTKSRKRQGGSPSGLAGRPPLKKDSVGGGEREVKKLQEKAAEGVWLERLRRREAEERGSCEEKEDEHRLQELSLALSEAEHSREEALNALKEEQRRHQEALAALEEEKRNRENVLAALEYQTLAKEETLASLEEERKAREDTVTALGQQKQCKEEAVASLGEEKRGKEEAVAALVEEMRRTEEALASLKEEKRGKEEAVAALVEETRRTEEALASLKEEKRGKEEAVAALVEETRRTEEALASLKEEKRGKEEAVAALVEETRRTEEALASLKEEKRVKEEAVAALVEETRRTEEALASLKEEKRGKEEAVAALVEETRRTEEALASLKEEKRGKEEAVAALVEETRRTEEALASLKEEKRGKEEAVAALVEETRRTEEALASLKEEKRGKEEAQPALEEERKEISRLMEEGAEREQEGDALRQEARQLISKLEATEREVAEQKARAAQASVDLQAAQAQLEKHTEEIQEKTVQINSLAQEVQGLKRDLETSAALVGTEREGGREQMSALRKDLAVEKEESETKRRRVLELEHELAQVKEQLDHKQLTTDQQLEELREKLNHQELTSKQQLEELRKKLQDQELTTQALDELREKLQLQGPAEQELEQLRTKLHELTQSSEKQAEELRQNLREQEAALQCQLEEFNRELSTQQATSDLDHLKQKLSQQEQISEQLRAELKEARREPQGAIGDASSAAENDSLRRLNSDLQGEVAALRAKDTGMKEEWERALSQAARNQLSSSPADKERETERKLAEKETLSAEREAELQKKLAEKESQVSSLQKSLREAQGQREEEESQAVREARRREAERRRELLAVAEEAIAQKDAELEKKSQEISRLKDGAKQDSDRVKTMSLDLQRKEDDTADLREKLADSKKQIQQVQKEVSAMREEEKCLKQKLGDGEKSRKQLQSDLASRDRTIHQLRTEQSSDSKPDQTAQLYQKACKDLETKERVVEDMRLALTEQDETQEQMEQRLEEKHELIQELNDEVEKLKEMLQKQHGGKVPPPQRYSQSDDLKLAKQEAANAQDSLKLCTEKHQADRRKWLEEKMALIHQAKAAEDKRNQDMRKFADDRERHARQQSQLECLESQMAEKDQAMERWRQERDSLVTALEIQLQKLVTSNGDKDKLIQQLRCTDTQPPLESGGGGVEELQASLSELLRPKEQLKALTDQHRETTTQTKREESPAVVGGKPRNKAINRKSGGRSYARGSVSSQGSASSPTVLDSSEISTENGRTRRFPKPELEISFSPMQPNRIALRRQGEESSVTVKISRPPCKRKSADMEKSSSPAGGSDSQSSVRSKKEGALQKIGEFLQSSPTLIGTKAKKMMSLVSGQCDGDSTTSSSRSKKKKLNTPEISSPMDLPSHPIISREPEWEYDRLIIKRLPPHRKRK
ncbi:uncharacterized protein kif20ba [Diretmus argenteus]